MARLVASNRHRRDRCRTAAPHPRGHRPHGSPNTPDHVALDRGRRLLDLSRTGSARRRGCRRSRVARHQGGRPDDHRQRKLHRAGRAAAGGEPDRRLGDRRQSAVVAARTRPDPRSQRRAADVLHLSRFEGSCGPRVALRRGEPATRPFAVDRRDGAERSARSPNRSRRIRRNRSRF